MSQIQEGIYKVRITEAEWCKNSKGTGHYLKIHFTITDDSDAYNKTVYDYFNFDNPSEIAVKKSQSKWIILCSCAELGTLSFDWKKGPTTDIVRKVRQKEVYIEVEHQPSNRDYVFYKIKKFLPINFPNPNSIVEKQMEENKEVPKNFDDLNDEIPF